MRYPPAGAAIRGPVIEPVRGERRRQLGPFSLSSCPIVIGIAGFRAELAGQLSEAHVSII